LPFKTPNPTPVFSEPAPVAAWASLPIMVLLEPVEFKPALLPTYTIELPVVVALPAE
jgi:hypothetical protein